VDIHRIVSKARLAIQKKGVRLVIVDYLQLIKATGHERRDMVSEATNQLRMLAKETGIPVMALSQLRRPHSLNDRPTMIDLKESGDIEAHAHVVLLLYMPMAQDTRPSGEEEIIIGKQREGPTGTVPVFFKGSHRIFAERRTA
jgi:replicative DNA helicase